MLSVKIISGRTPGARAEAAAYYSDHLRQGDSAVRYYGGPGRMLGSAAPPSAATADELTRILSGQDVTSGEPLYDPQRHSRTGGVPEAVAADLTFSAPKSVAVIFAFGPPDLAASIEDCHNRAVAAAMRFIERDVAHVRRGHGGQRRIPVQGVCALAVTHHTTRADDPQLHTHVLLSLLAAGNDGATVSMLDTRLLHAASRAAGSIYQVELRHQLAKTLGVRWTPTTNGTAEIAGVPTELLHEFSIRSQEIAAELRRVGIVEGSAKARQLAAVRTRSAKSGRDAGNLRDEWAERSRRLGIEPTALVEAAIGNRQPVRRDDRHVVTSALSELTTHHAHFGRREVLYALAEQVDASWSSEQVLRAMGFLEHDRTAVQLTEERKAGDWLLRSSGPRWTTREMLAAEQAVVDNLTALRQRRGPRCPTPQLQEAVRRHQLNHGQEALIRTVCRDGTMAPVITGFAGTGKTCAAKVATELLRESGRTVIGAAPSGRAADQLMSSAGLDWAGSLTQLRLALERGSVESIDAATGHATRISLTGQPHMTVMIDEAGMASTRDLRWVTQICLDRNIQLVLLGDPLQLQPVEAGGIAHDIDSDTELVEVVRAEQEWERTAQLEIRAGDAAAGWDAYRTNGRVNLTTDPGDATTQVFHAWRKDREAQLRTAMIAYRRADVIALNLAARNERIRNNELHPKAEVSVRTADGQWSLCRGDEIITTTPVTGLRNGATGTVETVHQDGAITIRLHDVSETGRSQQRLTRVAADAVRDGAVALGYAITGHRSQGATFDTAHVLADAAADRQWCYVAMSRGRTANHLVFTVEPDDHETHGPTITAETKEWEAFLSAATRDGTQSSARSVLRMRPTETAQRAAERLAETEDDRLELAWRMSDKAQDRRHSTRSVSREMLR